MTEPEMTEPKVDEAEMTEAETPTTDEPMATAESTAATEAPVAADEPPVAQRHPLRLLAEIRGLPLYVTTTPDSLLKRVLARVRDLRDEDVRGFQLVRDIPKRATTADQRATFAWDLPPGWDPSMTSGSRLARAA